MAKICTKCKINKELNQFGKDKYSKDGFTVSCKSCRAINTSKWRRKNPEKVKDYKKSERGKESARRGTAKYRKKHPDRVEAYQKSDRGRELSKKRRKRYYHRHKDIENKRYKEYYYDNHQKEKIRRREYSKNNPGFDKYHCSLRYTRKLKATPSWVDLNAIKDIYLRCPEGYEVDHIIPLQGKTVCGLHVPWNLQYLTKSENCSKSNKF